MKVLLYLSAVLLVFSGCDKMGLSSKWTYSIKGKLLQDCGGTPIANYDLQLKYKSAGPLDKASKMLGTATTDAQGNFTISGISIEYLNSLYLQHVVNANDVDNWWYGGNITRPTSDNEIIDLGTFYEEFEMFTIAKVNINTANFSPADTLYLGGVIGNYNYYYPIPQSVIFSGSEMQYNRGLGQGNPKGWGLVWGRNKKDFDSARNNTNLGYHLLYSRIGICTQPDTSFLNIP